MRSFTLTQKARTDMLSIGRYTRKQWGKVQQRRYLSQLDSTFHDLADNPTSGRACDGIRVGYYKYGVGKHVIFYRHAEKDRIEIVRILHHRMDIEQHV
ncbi:type II toxin-antitoxin system RelE/ParE family toxin [Nitrosomonas ureae]|uniref:Toxin n=1 Tax=Nitrosomonas ureae TaxID=44577 RepID=A0A1H5T126_9PROT|nr:type II toxin-antitoxin system RelE/ParE family toxin [Nitrosomonas ureae]SEF55737.1 toxin ParE1/3/4 [Nitrosomonas ureae]